ncbi:MAG TPA: type II toxin-antitoxin system RelE/ParE family toxin [Candidatus Elarobacter sp.]|nr:type II toxin-antitoxin system RelE/ParE family toxin [Candidatus Elarobacter sp.]
MWEIEGTDEFAAWYGSLGAADQEHVDYVVSKLEVAGPTLARPAVDTVYGSRFANMKELRINTPPIRIFFAFDPRRTAILLIGGDKTNDPGFYDRMIPAADRLYAEHLTHLENEHGV